MIVAKKQAAYRQTSKKPVLEMHGIVTQYFVHHIKLCMSN